MGRRRVVRRVRRTYTERPITLYLSRSLSLNEGQGIIVENEDARLRKMKKKELN